MEKFFKAVAMATEAHHNQRRKSSTDPYIAHPMRVAYLAIDAGLSINACCAAVLHDVPEDTNVEIETIYKLFGNGVGKTVHCLTKWWSDDISADEKEANMIEYYQQILLDENAVNIKLLDRIDNLKDMLSLLPKQTRWVRKYLTKTEKEFPALYNASKNEVIKTLYDGTLRLVKSRLDELDKAFDAKKNVWNN